MDLEIRQQLRRIFDEVSIELGPPFDRWRVTPAEPDLRFDRRYPALCYWVYDHRDRAHAFSFPDRPDQSDLDWLRPELRQKLVVLATAEYPLVDVMPTEGGHRYRCPVCKRMVHLDGDDPNYAHNGSFGLWTPTCGHTVRLPNVF